MTCPVCATNTCTLDKSLFPRYQKSTVMFNWSPCRKEAEGVEEINVKSDREKLKYVNRKEKIEEGKKYRGEV